jgi:glycosyltransferase involved in cell wall biosynthesis
MIDVKRNSRDTRQAVPITVISSSGDFGGAEDVMLSLLEALGGDWVRSVIFLAPGPVVDEVRRHGLPTQVIRERHGIRLLRAALEVRRILRSETTTVVHANHLRAAFVGVLATAGTPRRVVWHRHDSTGSGLIGRAIARRADAVVGVSHTVNEIFRGSTRAKLRTVYNGVPSLNIDRYAAREVVLKRIGASAGPVVVLAARLSPQKGQLDLIEAMPSLLIKHPDLRVAFLGAENWPYVGYKRRLLDRARELKVSQAISFLGHLPSGDAPTSAVGFIAGCDLLVAPSRRERGSGWQEGFGLAPLQAMAIGTPVVAYHHGAFPETLGDCARLVPEGDTDTLSYEISQVLSNPRLRSQMVACGEERVRRFRPEIAIDEMKRIYRDVVEK